MVLLVLLSTYCMLRAKSLLPSGRPAVIMIKFPSYKGNGIGPDNLDPLTSILRSWPSGDEQCSRLRFPLVVRYVISIHILQGLTLDKVICN